MNDVVVDIGYQNITAPKIFTETIHVNNNIEVETINGYSIGKIYENSVLLDQPNSIDNMVRKCIYNKKFKILYIFPIFLDCIRSSICRRHTSKQN